MADDKPFDPTGSNEPEIKPKLNFDDARAEANVFANDFEKSLEDTFDNVRKAMEKSLNFDKIKDDFERSFGQSIVGVSDEFKKGMEAAIGNSSKLQKNYYNLVATKERKFFDKIKDSYNKVGRQLTSNAKREESLRKNIFTLAKKQQRELSKQELKDIEQSFKKEKRTLEQLTELKKKKQAELKAAEFKARASEGRLTMGERAGSGMKKALGHLGGSIPILGKFVKGLNVWGVALTGLMAVFSKLFFAFVQRRRDVAQLGAAFRNAGLSASEAEKAINTLSKEFNKIDLSAFGITPSKLRREILMPLSEYPSALAEISDASGEGAQRAIKLSLALADVGKTIPDAIKSIGEAAKDQAIDTKEYLRLYKLARGASEESVRGFDLMMNTVLNLNKSLRSVTFDTTESEKMFALMSGTLKTFTGALRLSDQEVSDFILSLGKGTANLKFQDIAGMFAFVKGQMPTGRDFEDIAKSGGVFALQLQMLHKLLGSELKGSLADMSEVGMPTLIKSMEAAKLSIPESQLAHFIKLLNETKDILGEEGADEFNKKAKKFLEDMKTPQTDFEAAVSRGEKTLRDITSPMSKIAAGIETLADRTVGIPKVAELLGKMIGIIESPRRAISGTVGFLGNLFGGGMERTPARQVLPEWEKNIRREAREPFTVEQSSGGAAKGFMP